MVERINSKIEDQKIQLYDLESSNIDLSDVEFYEEKKGRWVFLVENREMGRKIAYEFAKILNTADFIKYGIENPNPVDDFRLDGNQISFSEFDKNDENKKEIIRIEISIRNLNKEDENDQEYYERFKFAINSILELIKRAKSNN